jgi:hypothetical protein
MSTTRYRIRKDHHFNLTNDERRGRKPLAWTVYRSTPHPWIPDTIRWERIGPRSATHAGALRVLANLTKDSLPCGCENSFNAVHLLDH